MAEKDKRLQENVPGKYYIDSECINCELCVEIAPGLFKTENESGNFNSEGSDRFLSH